MNLIKRILEYLLGLFKSDSITPNIDKKIAENKEKIKEIDSEIEDEYNTVEEAEGEWDND